MNITRALGEILPITVSTAIPFEFLVSNPNRKKYKSIYISIETLCRNAISCMDNKNSSAEEVFNAVMDDIVKLGRFIKSELDGMYIFLYTTTLKSLAREFSASELITAKTEKQRTLKVLLRTTEAMLKKEFNEIIIHVDCFLKPERGFVDAIILTAFPTELLKARRFNNIALLESYTGKLKTRLEWNTKLTNGKNLLNIPFNRFSLSIFGDNGKLLKPMDKKTKEAVLLIALKGGWHADVTLALQRSHINSYYKLDNKEKILQLLITE